MKKTFRLASLVLGAVAMTSVGFATSVPLCASVAGSGTVASTYEGYGSGGCQLGDKIFSNFVFTNDAVWTTITPLNPDPLHEGFNFGGAFAADGSFFTAAVFYDVTVIGGAPLIEDMTLSIGGIGQIPDGTSFDVGEDITNGGNLIGSLDVGNFGHPLVLTDTANWSPVSSIHVVKDVSIYPCGVNSTGECTTQFNFSEITQIVSQVPEPMTLSMMGIGLLGLGLLRRRQVGKK